MAWEQFENYDDVMRKKKIVECANKYKPENTLDVGCGEGFITNSLPGDFIFGIDTAQISIARADRFKTNSKAVFAAGDITMPNLLPYASKFDMIVMSGVLYKENIQNKESTVLDNINRLLKHNGILVLCHVEPWTYVKIPYELIEKTYFAYQKYQQKLEVYRKS